MEKKSIIELAIKAKDFVSELTAIMLRENLKGDKLRFAAGFLLRSNSLRPEE
jgi:hypothetical protein